MRLSSFVPLTALVAAGFLFTGCYTVQYAVPSEQARDSYDVTDSFEVKKRASWVIFGLVPVQEAEVAEIVAREVQRADGDAATNVVVTAQYDPVDVVVGALLGGIFNTRSYTVTGDIVRVKGGMARVSPEEGFEAESPILGEIRYE